MDIKLIKIILYSFHFIYFMIIIYYINKDLKELNKKIKEDET